MEDYVYCPSDVNLSNISKLLNSASVIQEQRILEMYELACQASSYYKKLSSEGLLCYEILSLISEGFGNADISVHCDALEENKTFLNWCSKVENTLDRTVFCDVLIKVLKNFGITLKESDFLNESSLIGERIVYVRNTLSDEAFDVFSESFTDPRVRYAQDLKSAVRIVVTGDADYCILPLEERGSRIASIAQIVYDSDLKINDVTPVFGFDGSSDMKYALLSREFSIPEITPDDDRYLEIRVDASNERALSEIFSVSDYFRAYPYRVNTVDFESEGARRTYHSLVFKDEGGDFTSFLLYLTLFISDFTPLGIYKNLE